HDVVGAVAVGVVAELAVRYRRLVERVIPEWREARNDVGHVALAVLGAEVAGVAGGASGRAGGVALDGGGADRGFYGGQLLVHQVLDHTPQPHGVGALRLVADGGGGEGEAGAGGGQVLLVAVEELGRLEVDVVVLVVGGVAIGDGVEQLHRRPGLHGRARAR